MQATTRHQFSRKITWLLVGGAGTAAAGYIAYRYWLKDYVDQRITAASDAIGHVYKIFETAVSASELSSSVLVDLKAFLESDSDEVPRSIRQLLKLSRNQEFQQAILTTTESVAVGISRGCMDIAVHPSQQRQQSQQQGLQQQRGIVETVLEKLFTDEGKSFASAVTARMVRALVLSLSAPTAAQPSDTSRNGSPLGRAQGSAESQGAMSSQAAGQQAWQLVLFDLVATERGKDLVAEIVKTFAIHSVGTFLDKTSDINMYHDMLVGISGHQELVKDLSGHIISHTLREAYHTWQAGQRGPVLRRNVPRSGSCSSFASSPRAADIPITGFSDSDNEVPSEIIITNQQQSHAADLAKYLAQPAIRQLVLDVTATATARGMEAFLLVLMYKAFGALNISRITDAPQSAQAGSSIPASSSCAGTSLDACLPNVPQIRHIYTGDAKLLASRALAVASVCLAVLLNFVSS